MSLENPDKPMHTPEDVERIRKELLTKFTPQELRDFIHTVEVLIGTGRAKYEMDQRSKEQQSEGEK